MLVEILVFPGVDELDALGPLEVLRNAAALGAKFDVRLVSLDGDAYIRGQHSLRFGVDGKLGSRGRPDLLIVPGGGWAKRAPEGAWAEARKGDVPAAIARLYSEGTLLASVCTGTMLIATAGLLKGRSAITHHAAIEDLRAAGSEVVASRIVDDRDIVTAGGVTSGIDLGLYLVERFASRELADRVAKGLEYERRGPVHFAAGPVGSARA